MKDTTFFPAPEQVARTAIVYQPTMDKKDIEPGKSWIGDEQTPNPSGGLSSTASDLVRFYQMCLNGGELNGKRILSASAVKEMTSLQTDDMQAGLAPETGWGLGFTLVRKPLPTTATLAPGSYGHGGAFGTNGMIDPSRDLITVLLIARQNFSGEGTVDVRAEFLKLAIAAIKD
jgi:CubicO group peptidase (beta-lactamase class C family)